VVHGQYRIAVLQVFGREQGICWQGTNGVNATGAAGLESGNNGIDLLAAKVTAFTSVGVESAHQDAWIADAKTRPQFTRHNAENLDQQFPGDRPRHRRERQMCRCQGYPQTLRGQHHHDPGGCRVLRQKLGVAAEGNTRFIDNSLVYRPRDQGLTLALERVL